MNADVLDSVEEQDDEATEPKGVSVGTKVEISTELHKTSTEKLPDQSTFFPLENQEEFEEVAEEFQEGGVRETYESPSINKAPKGDPFKAFNAIVERVLEFLGTDIMQKFNLRVKDYGSGAFIYQGGISNVWARIDRRGVVHCYRSVLERRLIKAGIMEPVIPIEKSGSSSI